MASNSRGHSIISIPKEDDTKDTDTSARSLEGNPFLSEQEDAQRALEIRCGWKRTSTFILQWLLKLSTYFTEYSLVGSKFLLLWKCRFHESITHWIIKKIFGRYFFELLE